MHLLSEQSAKVNKTLKVFPDYAYRIQYMQPRFSPGMNTCPFSTEACRSVCLQFCGRLGYSKAKVERTDLYFSDSNLYYQKLTVEIAEQLHRAQKTGKYLALRLNGTSDIDFSPVWTNERFKDVQFNEYTKNHNLARKFLALNKQGKHLNVHFTLSFSGKNEKECKEFLQEGGNVAVVFVGGIPNTFWGFKVISGDTHDFRFKDEPGTVVGLIAKSPMGTKKVKEEFIRTGIDGGFIVRNPAENGKEHRG